MPGAIDANGIWQYAEDDQLTSPTWSAYMNKAPASTSATVAAIKSNLGTVVAAESNATQTGGSAADFTSTVQIAVPPGRWLVQAHASVTNTTTSDTASVSLWNVTTGAEVASSIGAAALTTTISTASLSSRLVVLTVATSITLAPRIRRNGGSTVQVATFAGAPAASIEAIRLT